MNIHSSKQYLSDLDTAVSNSIGIEKLKNKTILITGATGTIGAFVSDTLLRYNANSKANVHLILAGRSLEKLQNLYSEFGGQNVKFVKYDVDEAISFDEDIDYIIHAAGNAHPQAFNGNPVGTIIGNVCGTYNLLEYARTHGAKRLLYVSSGEVYGQGDGTQDEYDEKFAGYVDVMSSRACYPSSKRAAENLCASYCAQYGLETVIVRPCHTYGPNFTKADSRAHAQFIRNVLNDEDIVMKSAGTQLRSYNYIADCVSAMLTVLAVGEAGNSYNIANPNVKVTIAEFAGVVAGVAGRKVIFSEPDSLDLANRTFISRQVLSSNKIEALGWRGSFSIEDGISHTLKILRGE